MSNQSALCYDVYIKIFSVLENPTDVLALMSTCKDLYDGGVKKLLGFGPDIGTEEGLVSFCLFMLRCLPRRGPLLTHLRISIERYPYIDDHEDPWSDDEDEYVGYECMDNPARCDTVAGGDMLRKVLRGATNLEYLDFDSIEGFMQRVPCLSDAIACLRNLHTLRTRSFGLQTLGIIRDLTSPLVKLDLFLHWDSTDRVTMDALQLIAPFRNTLEDVVLWHTDFSGTAHPFDKFTPVFPRVRRLGLHWQEGGLNILLMHHAFPNLSSLDMTGLQILHPPATTNHARAVNTRASASGRRGWRLENLVGDLASLYVLGHCHLPVPRLDIDGIVLNIPWVLTINEMVASTAPSHLLLHVGYDFTQVHNVLLLGYSLCRVDASCVTHFALDVCADLVTHAGLGIARFFETVVGAVLRRLPNLQVCIIRIQRFPLGPESDFDDFDVAFKPTSPMEMLRIEFVRQGISLSKLASLVGGSAPLLRFFAIDVLNYSVRYFTFERVPLQERLATLHTREVPMSRGMEIIAAEGMSWWRRGEAPDRGATVPIAEPLIV